jgi:TfoX/Sxy family transcriptional regulator of competence genes
MAFDEGLAERIRETVGAEPGLEEKKMFGGIGYLVNGNLAVGIHGDELIVRMGPSVPDEVLAAPHVRPFDITGKPMKGWLLVDQAGLEDDAAFRDWVERGLTFARSLPPK